MRKIVFMLLIVGAVALVGAIADAEGRPAERAGFRDGDVIVAFNGVEYADGDKAALKQAKQAMHPGGTVTYTVARSDERRDLAVELARVPDAVLARWIGGHMLESHARLAEHDY